jgi:hypothetical protein
VPCLKRFNRISRDTCNVLATEWTSNIYQHISTYYSLGSKDVKHQHHQVSISNSPVTLSAPQLRWATSHPLRLWTSWECAENAPGATDALMFSHFKLQIYLRHLETFKYWDKNRQDIPVNIINIY